MKPAMILPVITLVAVGLSACAKDVPATAPSPTPTATLSSSSSPTPTVSPTPRPTPTPLPGVPLGKPAIYTGQGKWSIILDQMHCGLASVPNADLNPNWQGTGQQQYIPARPAKGMDFCELTWTWRNLGTDQTSISMAGDIMVNGQRIERSSEDMARSMAVTKTRIGVDYTLPVEAGTTTKRIDIYQVPHGTKPSLVWAPIGANPIAFRPTKP